jgi:uncharacterized protein YaaN involved in tellurite resistance
MNYTLTHISDVINEVFNLDIKSKCRKIDNMNALKTYCYFARLYTPKGLISVAKHVNRKHSTIIHHQKDYVSIIKHDKELRQKHNKCLELLNINENKDIDHLVEQINMLRAEVEELKTKFSQKWHHHHTIK